MRVAINGLGRIGRNTLKIALEKGINIVAVNDLTDTKTLAYLLKYDSIYGNYNKKIEAVDGFLKIGNRKIKVLSEKDPTKLPWKKLKIDLVIESTGFFTKKKDAEKHIKAGAKRVVISAPGKEGVKIIVLGVNEDVISKNDKIISMASCTTNCLAPVAKVLNDEFKIVRGFMTTVHGYTANQGLQDSPHKKLRRGRAAGVNIVPTSSGATSATVKVIPELEGKIDGLAMRVPVACGSIVDFVVELGKDVSREEVNSALKKAANGKMKGILAYSEEELVSSDIINYPCSSIVDGLSTQVLGGNFIKVLSWYDNEVGYSTRLVELVKRL